MAKPEPMTSFVDKGTSLTILASTAGCRLEKKYNTIMDGIRRIVDGKSGIAVQAGIVETAMIVRQIC